MIGQSYPWSLEFAMESGDIATFTLIDRYQWRAVSSTDKRENKYVGLPVDRRLGASRGLPKAYS